VTQPEPGPGVPRLLYEVCVELGFCLPPDQRRQFLEHPPTGVDAFTDALFVAEGLDPGEDPPLRRRVREVVARHLPA
jgi:hypothetical protein